MKTFIAWAKSNLPVAILMVLAILAIPTTIFFSKSWHGKIQDGIKNDTEQTLRELNNIKVTYTVPAIVPGGQDVVVSGPPNRATTDAVRELLQDLKAQTESVQQEAIDWNSRGKTVLFAERDAADRIFPAPVDESARYRLTDEMKRVWPAAHEELLNQYRVGQPPAIEDLVADLERIREREQTAIIEGRVEQELSPEESARITETLRKEREQRYRSAASRITVYGDMSAFTAVKPLGENDVPPVETLWDWQHMLWIHNDILAAIEFANSTADGRWLRVYEAPVKRILSIDVEPREYAGGGNSSSNSAPAGRDPFASAGGGGGDTGAAAGPLGQNYSVAHTGRAGWPATTNAVYDVRDVTLKVVVASDRMQDLLQAISRTNFMTVIDIDLEPADSYDDFRQGYAYGSDHTVTATIKIETVWIHAWIKDAMPAAVRTALGVPADPDPVPGAEVPAETNDDMNADPSTGGQPAGRM